MPTREELEAQYDELSAKRGQLRDQVHLLNEEGRAVTIRMEAVSRHLSVLGDEPTDPWPPRAA